MLPHPPSTANPQNSHIRGLRPLKPTSVHGATKLASEALITTYAHTYGFKAAIYRLANILGPRSKHSVIYDFTQKLKTNPNELEILGGGTQNKFYLQINDCIRAMLLGSIEAKTQSKSTT